jgi:hypothetical protein
MAVDAFHSLDWQSTIEKTDQIRKAAQRSDARHARTASDHPDRWHNLGKLEATRKAAQLLAQRGVIEIFPETNGYRLKPKK